MNTTQNASENPVTVDGLKQQLVLDLKRVAADTASLLKEVTDSTAEGFAARRTKFEARFAEAKAGLDGARAAATARVKAAADAANKQVIEKPWTSVGAAAVVGIVVGYLFRRR